MKSILFLSVVMEQGWGVSLEIGEICRRLRRDGVKAFVGAQRIDSSFDWLNVTPVKPTAKEVRTLARKLGVSVVAAQTSPYFEVLPELSDEFETWAWENGDPTPSFFPESAQHRRLVAEYKREYVYPRVHRVIAISDFIKHDVLWPEAEAILLGGDHMPTPPLKTASDLAHLKNGKVRVGTLMRLGEGEAQYKGSHLFLSLVEAAQKRGIPIEAHVAGRGTEQDAASFVARGIIPHLNLSEEQKADYLRSLDVFVSFSLWEGFNLPVVEAQTLGTLSLALDVGAHPEVCPYLLKEPFEALTYLVRASEDPAWLESASRLAANFARSRLSWENTSDRVKEMLGYAPNAITKQRKLGIVRTTTGRINPKLHSVHRFVKRLVSGT